MRITQIELFAFDGTAMPTRWRPVGCRIHTDEGICGDGEAALAYGAGGGAFGMLRDLAEIAIGADPLQPEVLWNKLYKTTFWGQNGGPVFFAALSAIDCACWDIRGKFYNAPLSMLLGGRFRDKLRVYASQIQSGFCAGAPAMITPQDYADAAKSCAGLGYDCVKADVLAFDERGELFNPDRRKGPMDQRTLAVAIDRLTAMREAVGPAFDIIIENHSYLDANAAIQLARAAEPLGIFYFEEPNTPSVATSRYLKEKINIPIANGERLYSRWQYVPYFEENLIQIIQPDIGNCGGITEVKKICDMAYVYDVGVQLHVCASPLGIALALQLEAALPYFVIHEHHVLFLQQGNIDLCARDYQPKNGYIEVPSLPGIGNEWSERAIAAALRRERIGRR